MPRVFAITSSSKTVTLDPQGGGKVTFTVTNTGSEPLTARCRLAPEEPAAEGWFEPLERPERRLEPEATEQLTVAVAVPAGTAAGGYSFRLDATSVENPDEHHVEGQSVAFEVAPPPPEKKAGFPWWILIVAGVLVAGLLAWLLWPSGDPGLGESCENECADGLVCNEAKVCVGELGFAGCSGGGDCAAGLDCYEVEEGGEQVSLCLGALGFTGCGEANDCGESLVCEDGTCRGENARPVELGQLTGMSESDARRRIRDLELAVGEVGRRSQWAADGFIVAQSAEGALSAGDTVDLIVADSEFSFRSSRRVKSEDEDITATVEYTVRRLRQDATSGDIGEVSITRLTVSPDEGRMSHIVDRLVSSSAYVRLDDLENIDLIASWEVLADLQREVADSMATQSLSSGNQGFESLGEGVLLMLLMIELEFDIRSILAPPPGILGNNAETVELQSGSELKSSIRVQGEPATVAAGEAYSFEVARRVPGDEDFKNVGRATYAARDGLLRSLSAGFFLGTTEDAYLQVKLERL